MKSNPVREQLLDAIRSWFAYPSEYWCDAITQKPRRPDPAYLGWLQSLVAPKPSRGTR